MTRLPIAAVCTFFLSACGPDRPAAFHETMVDGRLGFELYLPEPTWKAMTAHSLGLTSALLDDRVHASINAMIERGIAARHLPCPRQWLLNEIGPADAGGVLFIGLCATPEEIRAVESGELANTI
jgi:hypothetical protein